MLNLNLNIRNPWSNRFENLWFVVYESVFKHKYIEIELYKDSNILTFNFDWTIRQDHAGLSIELGLFGYTVHYNFYDNRHWNTEAGRYYKYNEEEGMC